VVSSRTKPSRGAQVELGRVEVNARGGDDLEGRRRDFWADAVPTDHGHAVARLVTHRCSLPLFSILLAWAGGWQLRLF
jgi:hypothetical protein